MNRDERAFIRAMEMQVEQATLGSLREIEIFSDAEGRYIFHLARMYVHA